jgi:membrane fusion protein (multidrug efflux system)
MKKIAILLEKAKFALAKIRFKLKSLKIPRLKIKEFKPQNVKDLIKKFREKLKDRRFKKNFFIGLTVAIVLAVIAGRTIGNIQKTVFKKKEAKRPPAITFEEGLTPVKVLKIKKMDFKDTLPIMGNIKGFKEVDLKFQTSGIIESINFEEGEKIQEGDIIASLIQKEALLKLKYSSLEMEKSQKLFDIGGIAQPKLEQSKLEYESAKTELDKTNIYAISDGLLGSRILDVGSYVTPNDKIGTFIDIGKVYAEFSVIEKDIPKIALKQKADVFVDAFPTKTLSGQIDRIAPIVEGRSRTQTIKVEIPNKDLSLKPGMFCRALVYTYEKKDVLVVPASGLKKKETDYLVYVVHKEELKEPKEEVDEKGKKKRPWNIFGAKAKKKAKEEASSEIPKEKPMETGAI